ncbi:hypothetical protein ACFFGH_33985 [Lysobacter korlensis]|uniref:Uncharacterized protein n=1 Tax=Lysobacter korlensis TaxID=553636 RepID=A0ABV6S0V7_9GAMM
MLEFVFEVVGELLIQLVLETLAELGLHSRRQRRKPVNPAVAAFGYAIFGASAGGLSLVLFPESLVPEGWRLANLIVSPVIAGAAMVGIGAWRAKLGQELVRMDRFLYGYLFALALAAVRYQFAG